MVEGAGCSWRPGLFPGGSASRSEADCPSLEALLPLAEGQCPSLDGRFLGARPWFFRDGSAPRPEGQCSSLAGLLPWRKVTAFRSMAGSMTQGRGSSLEALTLGGRSALRASLRQRTRRQPRQPRESHRLPTLSGWCLCRWQPLVDLLTTGAPAGLRGKFPERFG